MSTWSLTLQETQVVIEAWRREYNEERTHSRIGDVTPMEFIKNHQDRSQAAQESTSLVVGLSLWSPLRLALLQKNQCP